MLFHIFGTAAREFWPCARVTRVTIFLSSSTFMAWYLLKRHQAIKVEDDSARDQYTLVGLKGGRMTVLDESGESGRE